MTFMQSNKYHGRYSLLFIKWDKYKYGSDKFGTQSNWTVGPEGKIKFYLELEKD